MPRKKKKAVNKKKPPVDIEVKNPCWQVDPKTHRKLFIPPKKNVFDKKTVDS
ncbi:hypothetical protein LCGC14_1981690 [marine sediment metagenome]|uniref:Uncharacterized protein n=1 Tax=marine sediment metagenome TaxID=412755 RepID=A0A0F9I5Q9_9ZZZZ